MNREKELPQQSGGDITNPVVRFLVGAFIVVGTAAGLATANYTVMNSFDDNIILDSAIFKIGSSVALGGAALAGAVASMKQSN